MELRSADQEQVIAAGISANRQASDLQHAIVDHVAAEWRYDCRPRLVVDY